MSSVCMVQTASCGEAEDMGTTLLCVNEKVEEYNVEELMRQISSGSQQEKQTALNTLLELLEDEREGVAEALMDVDTVSALMKRLDDGEDVSSQLTALVMFANITSGTKEQNQVVVNCGAVLPFIQLIHNSQITIAEQAIICVGNIACEDAFNRKVLYENGGLEAVIRFLNRGDLDETQFNSAVWAFSNMCRSRMLISHEVMVTCVEVIKQLLESEDPEILRSACGASAYLADGPSRRIQVFLDGGVCKSIMGLLHHATPLVVFSALRAVSNFLSGSDEQIEAMIEMGIVASLAHVLKGHKERRIIKEACMALSNIAAGSQRDIAKIVEEDLVLHLIDAARHAPIDVRTEAIWAIGNAVVGSGHALIKEFLTPECMKVLSAALTSKNLDIVKLALQAIRNFLWCGDFGEDPNFDLATWNAENDEDFWEHAEWLSNAHGFYRLAKLRQHHDEEIAKSSFALLDVLIEDPYAEYSDEDVDRASDSDDEENEYEDLLLTITSPTAR